MKLFWKKYQFDFIHSFFGWWTIISMLQCQILERDFVFDAALLLHLSPSCQSAVLAHGALEVRGRKELVEVLSWEEISIDSPLQSFAV